MHRKGTGKAVQNVNCRVPLLPLEAADIGAVDVGVIGKPVL
jgi:hypothetical protein